ncbi:hypothetical protein [uncultured Victivallis sp.]|uniref:hypothetical protein n=1 Tax=uncultured Victivallis sp. TaxID=354118 RepID=UPI0025FF67C9|nr:hypothetical protein [uncultured Victivallis sp.]
MSSPLWRFVLFAAGMSGLVSGQNVPLNQADGWSPMGDSPVVVRWDNEAEAISFAAERGEKKDACLIWPLYRVKDPEALREAVAIRFEMQYLPEGAPVAATGAVVLPKRPDGSGGTLPFAMPSPGKWSSVEVKFNRPPAEMVQVRTIQILVNSRAERMRILIRNLALVTGDGKSFDFRSTEKPLQKEVRHKLLPQGAPSAFVAAPGERRRYEFKTSLLPDGSVHDWVLTGMDGGETGRSGRAEVRNRVLSVEFSLPTGFYELRFPALGQLFGISILPPHSGNVDPFFAMEGLLEGRTRNLQENCLDLLVRNGISHNREWSDFAGLHPRSGEYVRRNDPLYRIAGTKGIRSIFAFTDFPAWLEPVANQAGRNILPGKLIGLDRAMERMLESRKAGVEGFQILNEYDGSTFPAEANLPPLKAAAWAARGREIALVGAAFCQGSTLIERESIAGGMLDFIDVFCIHTYAEPERMLSYVQEYRHDMKGHPKENMPIWITESGKPWHRGISGVVKQVYGGTLDNLHPQVEEDMISALWITMKAVEAKACGVARYYPFVMPFFQENNSNFGMLDYYGTPLRSMHAYSFAANLLAGQEYRGDWKDNPPGLQPTRVFSDGRRAVAVFYAGKDGIGERTVSLNGFPAGQGYAVDGTELKSGKEQLTFRGGMAYWVFPAEKLEAAKLNVETESKRMLEAAKRYQPVKRRCTPVVYRYDFRRSGSRYTAAGYEMPEDGKLQFIVTNFSDEKVTTHPRLTVPDGAVVTAPPPELLELPPRSETAIAVGISSLGRYCGGIRLGDAGDTLSSTTVTLLDSSQLKPETRDFLNPGRWHQNSSGKQTFRFHAEENAVEVRTDFRNKANPADNNWSFPEFRFKPEEKKRNLVAVSFDFCYDDRGETGIPLFPLLMLTYSGDKEYKSFPISSPGREWKHYWIPLRGTEEERPYDILRIGMGTRGNDLLFAIRNIQLWFE